MRLVVDAVARRHKLVTSTDVKALTAALRELSARYNAEGQEGPKATASSLHGARLQFSLARDLPKSREALGELRHGGLLPTTGPVRVLDLGAGLGATSLGALAALHDGGFRGVVQITLVEPDAKALELAKELVPQLTPAGLDVRVTARCESLDTAVPLRAGGREPPFDLVLFGQVLSEDERALAAGTRVERHADLLERALQHSVAKAGALLVIEPALRTRTRHLHQVRDQLLQRFVASTQGDYAPVVHSPCPHQGACGALARETDWCHEDRRVDLPAWLVPIARGAGLRWQGLTFSYLVLRRDGSRLAPGASRLVSELRQQKGKSDAQLCNEPGRWHRLECLDRDAPSIALWRELVRGDLIRVPPTDLERGRLSSGADLTRVHSVLEP